MDDCLDTVDVAEAAGAGLDLADRALTQAG
jgi:hypothetical protein